MAVGAVPVGDGVGDIPAGIGAGDGAEVGVGVSVLAGVGEAGAGEVGVGARVGVRSGLGRPTTTIPGSILGIHRLMSYTRILGNPL